MFHLQMLCKKDWVDVGAFDTQDEAVNCIFNVTYTYRVVDSNGRTCYVQEKVSRRSVM